MTENTSITLNRKQLYDAIWEISVAGVARKYNIPYVELLKLCKEKDIPIPQSGYWTKLRFGKPVVQTPLPELSGDNGILPMIFSEKLKDNSNVTNEIVKEKTITQDKSIAGILIESTGINTLEEKTSDVNCSVKLPYREVKGVINTYNREKLYEEVWTRPVSEVATQYGVSDVAIHKICNSLSIPVPPRGYWAKLRAGEKMEKPPLSSTNGPMEKTGSRSFDGDKENDIMLSFLSESELDKVQLSVQQVKVQVENAQLHRKIVSYKSVVNEWNKKASIPEGVQRNFTYSSNQPPFLAGVISDEMLPRVFRILDALYRQIEYLGGLINDDLSLKIRNEHICLEIVEAQDTIEHVITKQEAKELIIYEDAKRRNSWAHEPKIRKHDYVFNGRIRLSINRKKHFRDTNKANIESRLGDILIALYEESEVIRIEREAREEEIRRKEEEERLREEHRNRYNLEVERTNGLINIAQDYDIAFKIRAYIAALELKENLNENIAIWIEWAKKKADWLDPTTDREDELFKKREHEKSEEEKALKKVGRYWW